LDDTTEFVVLVDENDTEIGLAPKLNAHRTGELHRAFSVMLIDSANRLLLQRRAFAKYHSGGRWANTCCGHPRDGESVVEAAERRLTEEMGVACPLTTAGWFIYRADVGNGLVEHELDHLLIGRFDGDPVPAANEVAEWRWASLDDLRRDLEANAERYTTWLPHALRALARWQASGATATEW
jgi:isopentenyl-diphosphate delta-isomerase